MTFEERVELTEQQCRQAMKDYMAHTDSIVYKGYVSDAFYKNLARESVEKKQALREFFSQSPAWDEKLDALVISGQRSHTLDSDTVFTLAREFFPYNVSLDAEQIQVWDACKAIASAYYPEDVSQRLLQSCGWGFDLHKLVGALLNVHLTVSKTQIDLEMLEANTCSCWRPVYLDIFNVIAPNAIKQGKKLTRVVRDIAKEIGIYDETAGSNVQKRFARLSDLISRQKVDYTLFVSINPAHFLTMSNPKDDVRGEMLTSCHSLNRTDYGYNNGCTGYALDDITMIAFTASDPDKPETLNNRKTSRQLYMYEPGSGALLQSRMYDTTGGVNGKSELSKVYRQLIEREISEIEGVEDKWLVKPAASSPHSFNKDMCFGGYADWVHSEYAPKVALNKSFDHETHKRFFIGSEGLCLWCGSSITEGLLCEDCTEAYENGMWHKLTSHFTSCAHTEVPIAG